MHDKTQNSDHWSLWLIALVALIWNVMGCLNFIMQINPESLAVYPDTHRAIIEGRPVWATGAFAIAVFGGVMGCLLLLFRKSAASYLFLASLLAVIVTMLHSVTAIAGVDLTVFEMIMMVWMPPVVAVFLLWYAKLAQRKGWLG